MVVAAGAGVLFSALIVSYRDFRYVITFVVQLWLFATPVLYSIDIIPAKWRLLYAVEPDGRHDHRLSRRGARRAASARSDPRLDRRGRSAARGRRFAISPASSGGLLMSSSAVAIDIAGVSKRYTIGLANRATNFRESLVVDGGGSVEAPAPSRRPAHGGHRFLGAARRQLRRPRRRVIGIIGPNGAGKSTLLKILSRITPPTSGHIDLDGRVSSLLEVGTGFHPELTGRENIFLNGAILGMLRAEIRRKFDAIVDFAEVGAVHRHAGEALLERDVRPPGVFGRGASRAGDPDRRRGAGGRRSAFQKPCLGRMREMRDEGRTVLFVSHDLTSVRQLCNRAVMLIGGRVDRRRHARRGDAEVRADESRSVFTGCRWRRGARQSAAALPPAARRASQRRRSRHAQLRRRRGDGDSSLVERPGAGRIRSPRNSSCSTTPTS